MNDIIAQYLALTATALAAPTDANIDAIDAFEAAHPEVIDAAYHAAGPLVYEPVTGTVACA